MHVRASLASAVVVQRVPADRAEWFLEWQRGVTAAAEGFDGYRDTDVYPPADGERDEWVVVIHFRDEQSLQSWLDSPARSDWVAKLQARAGDFELRALPGGFGAWFAGRVRDTRAAPPGWKMVVTVVLGLYPTVMLLSMFVSPHTLPLGFAVSILIGNVLSVSILQWAVMPALTRLLAPWLHADPRRETALSVAGPVLILASLAGLAALFRLATG